MEVGGGRLAPLSVELVAEFRLRVGGEVDAAALGRLEVAAQGVECYDRALDALARRSRSRRGLERWLRERGYPDGAIVPAVERLEVLGLLDDLAFARGYARTRLRGRGFGPRRVAAELARHGVAQGIVDAVLLEATSEAADDVDTEGPESSRGSEVRDAAARRARSLASLAPEVAERRLVGWLVRRGFGVAESMRAARAELRAAAEPG